MSMGLVVFENSMFGAVSVVDHNGEPWFIASELAKILEYSATGAMTKLIQDEDKHLRTFLNGTTFINQLLINESGFYDAVFGSKKPTALAFKRWVVKEVLPAIRKTGAYVHREIPIKKSDLISESATAFKAFFEIGQLIGCDKNVAAISANQAVNKNYNINILEDMGQTHLVAVKQEIYFTPTELGKDRGLSGKAFNMILESIGLQRKEGKKWVPTESGLEFCKILDTGKKSGSGVSVTQMKWSEKVLPLIPSMN